MKKSLLIFGFLIIGWNHISSARIVKENPEYRFVYYKYGIEDGWYLAIVEYENTKTGTIATYTLNVKVEYNRVVKIAFGNGGSIHTGYNNSGYIYSGGTLSFEKDYYGSIRTATTTVTISDKYGLKYYEIRIK